jgi:hypothetical protein
VLGRPDLTVTRLLADVSAGIRVLHTRDGVRLTETQIRERAHNIVMGLVANFRIESLDELEADAPTPADRAEERLAWAAVAAAAVTAQSR